MNLHGKLAEWEFAIQGFKICKIANPIMKILFIPQKTQTVRDWSALKNKNRFNCF